MGELNANDIRAAIVNLKEYSNALTSYKMMLHPKAYEELQMALDFTTPEENIQEESLWDE